MKLTKIIGGLLAPLALALVAGQAQASGHAELMFFKADTGNIATLQRGAALFKGYCSGCHSLKYLRYNRMGEDLGLTEAQVKANFMGPNSKPGDVMLSNMPAASSDWFGAQPPDLSLVTRARGADWVYTYLNSFYVDPTRPLGVNNLVLPGASMPHVLAELQGWQEKVEHHAPEAAAEGHEKAEKAEHAAAAEHGHEAPLKLVAPGKLSEAEYLKLTADITNFLVYAGEPARNKRMATGWNVFFFLVVLFILTYLLKKEYWKDVH